MLFAALAIPAFLLAILFGIMLFTYVLQERRPPIILAHTHGACAGIGLILVLIAAVQTPAFWISATLFLCAASGGLYFLTRTLKNKLIPKQIAIVHGLFAFSGFVTLIFLVYLVSHYSI